MEVNLFSPQRVKVINNSITHVGDEFSMSYIFFGEICDRGEPQINSLPSVLEYPGANADNGAPKTSAELKYTCTWSHHPHIIAYHKWKLYVLCYKPEVFFMK